VYRRPICPQIGLRYTPQTNVDDHYKTSTQRVRGAMSREMEMAEMKQQAAHDDLRQINLR